MLEDKSWMHTLELGIASFESKQPKRTKTKLVDIVKSV
jgi:hypothetical protein